MVEELKLAIKVDDDSIEQSLLKQFTNAQKMADKVVLDFKNVNFDDKEIEAKFKALQKKAGQNPIDLSINKDSIQILSQISDKLGDIFKIAQGKSIIDSSSVNADIDKIENKLNELAKKYEELQKKSSGGISGKEVNLVDNEEFKKLSANFEKIKGEVDDLKTHMSLLSDNNVSGDSFVKLGSQVDGLSAKLDDLLGKYAELANVQKNLGVESNISLGDSDVTLIEEKIQDVGNGTKRIISEIGMSYDEFIKKIKSDNSLEERFAIFDKYGKVIESLKGNINSLVLPDNMNTSEASKIVHTHPSMNALGGTLSEDDYLQWYSKFLSKGIGEQFELLWRDKSLNIDLSNVKEELRASVISALVNISHIAGLQLEKIDGEIPLPLSDIYNSLSNGLLKDSVEKNGGIVSTEILDEAKNKAQNIETLITILNDFGNFRRINLNNDDAITERIEQYKSILKFLSDHEEYTYDQIKEILAYEKMTIIGTNSQGLNHNSMQLKNNVAEWMSEYLADNYSKINGLSVDSNNFDPFNMSSDSEKSYADITCKYYDAIAEAMDYVVRDALEGKISENDFVSEAMLSIGGEIGSLDDDKLLQSFLQSKEYVQEYIQNKFNELKTSMNSTSMIEVKKEEQFIENQAKETGNAIDEMIAKFSSSEIENMSNALTKCLRGLMDFDETAKSFGVTIDDLYTAQDIFKNKDLFNSLSLKDQMKDAIQVDNQTDIKSEATAMEQVEKATDEAVQAKKDFATANEGVQASVDDSKSPLQLEAELMDQIAKSAREAADAKKEFVEANKLVEKSADDSNSNLKTGHFENAESANVKKYKRKGNATPAKDTGNHDNEVVVNNKKELGKVLKQLQSEIIASIDESTSFVKEVTDFYDSQDNLVKTQMKVGDNNGSMRTYTTSYSKDKDGNTTAWTSHIETQKIAEQAKQQAKEQLEIDKQLAKEEENLAKARQKKWQAAQKEQVNYEEEQKKAEFIKKQTTAYEELTNTISKYSEVAKRVASGKAEDGDLELMAKLEDKISRLQKQPILSDSQVAKSEKSLVSLYDQLDKIEKKLVETNQKSQDKQISGFDKRIEGYDKKLASYQATASKFKDGGWTSDTYTQNIDKLNAAITNYKNLLAKVQNKGIASDKDIENLNQYESEIKQVISTVQNMSAAEKGFTKLDGQKTMNWISQQLRDNSKMSREAKNQIRAYYAQIESGNPTMSLAKIRAEVLEIVNAEEQAGRAGKSMFDAIKEKAFYGVAGAITTYFGFNDFLRYGREAIDTIVQLDDALVDLKKTTAMSGSELENFYYDSNDVAKQMGVTTKEIIDQASAWSRLNKIGLLYGDI